MALALEHIRIVELGYWLQGPYSAGILAQFGAEVIKIEQPRVGDHLRGLKSHLGVRTELGGGRNWMFEHHNLNKKSLAIDLKTDKGRGIAHTLIRKADVFVSNFRDSMLERLNMDYPTLSRLNPMLIYAIGSGYGTKGPDSELPGYDANLQARSGMMMTTVSPGNPPARISFAPADIMGATNLAMGILVGLVAREPLGRGQRVDASLLNSAMQLETVEIFSELFAHEGLERPDRTSVHNPLWNHYQCSDGKWIMLALVQADRWWSTLCRVAGCQEFIKDPRFDGWENREVNRRTLISLLDQVFVKRPRDEWIELFNQNELACAPVNAISDLFNDPQVIANDYIRDFDHPALGRIKLQGPIADLSETPAYTRSGAPEIGEHTESVLVDVCGLTWEEIGRLRDEGVI